MFLILTTKPGQFHTELTPDLIPVETHDYRMCGQHRARFVFAETADEYFADAVIGGSAVIIIKFTSK